MSVSTNFWRMPDTREGLARDILYCMHHEARYKKERARFEKEVIMQLEKLDCEIRILEQHRIRCGEHPLAKDLLPPQNDE